MSRPTAEPISRWVRYSKHVRRASILHFFHQPDSNHNPGAAEREVEWELLGGRIQGHQTTEGRENTAYVVSDTPNSVSIGRRGGFCFAIGTITSQGEKT
jgi:hypothetical protein